MIILKGMEMRISRGDTALIDIDLNGDVLPEGTTALVTASRKPGAEQPLWEKIIDVKDGTVELVLSSVDTDFSPKVYWWDLRLKTPDGQVQTPFPPQPFEILEVVGDVDG